MNNKLIVIAIVLIVLVFIINTRWNEFKTKWVLEQQAKNKEITEAGGTPTEPVTPTFFTFVSGTSTSTSTQVVEANKDFLISTLQQKYPSYSLSYQEKQLLKGLTVEDLQALVNMSKSEFEAWLSNLLGVTVQIP